MWQGIFFLRPASKRDGRYGNFEFYHELLWGSQMNYEAASCTAMMWQCDMTAEGMRSLRIGKLRSSSDHEAASCDGFVASQHEERAGGLVLADGFVA